jgi:hypothetical protein
MCMCVYINSTTHHHFASLTLSLRITSLHTAYTTLHFLTTTHLTKYYTTPHRTGRDHEAAAHHRGGGQGGQPVRLYMYMLLELELELLLLLLLCAVVILLCVAAHHRGGGQGGEPGRVSTTVRS